MLVSTEVQPVHGVSSFICSANTTECLLHAGLLFSGWGLCPQNPYNLNASVREYPDQAGIPDLSTLKIMYLFVFFILLSYTTLFREEFIFRAVILLGSTCLWDIWPSFLCSLQDKVWLFLSTSSWANRIYSQRLDPKRNDVFFCCCCYIVGF